MRKPKTMTDNRHWRPTLAVAVARYIEDGANSWHHHSADFLDGFYVDTDPESRKQRIADEPPLTGKPTLDAEIGAMGEHLCHRWQLGSPPDWTENPARFLSEPVYYGFKRMRATYEQDSPLAFRRRGIFTEAEPLRRARMPQD